MSTSRKGAVTRWRRFKGDTDSIQVQLNGIDAILPGASVSAKVVKDGTSVVLPAAVIDEANKIVAVTLTNWLEAAETTVGTYTLRVVLDDLTWPEEGEALIEVEAIP